MRKMCQSQQFVTCDAGFCQMEDFHDSLSHGIQASVTPAQTFAGKKLKPSAPRKLFFFIRT